MGIPLYLVIEVWAASHITRTAPIACVLAACGPEDTKLVALMMDKTNSVPQFRTQDILQHGPWHGNAAQTCLDVDKIALAVRKLLALMPSDSHSSARIRPSRETRNAQFALASSPRGEAHMQSGQRSSMWHVQVS